MIVVLQSIKKHYSIIFLKSHAIKFVLQIQKKTNQMRRWKRINMGKVHNLVLEL